MSGKDRSFLVESFVLHRRSYRESSLLVDVFTRERGLMRLLAKGARRGRSGRAGLLQPFAPLSLSWSGNPDLPVLSGAEGAGTAFELAGSALFCGLYLNELLIRLLPAQDSHPDLFHAYRRSLGELARGEPADRVLRIFELALLDEAGYGLLLDHESRLGQPIAADKFYEYRIEEGARECAPGPGTVRGSTLLGLREGIHLGPDEAREAKRLMRFVLGHYLGGRPLKSRELFRGFSHQ